MESANLRYNWKRFWCPRGGWIWFDDEGYLLDPEEEHSRFFRIDAVPFEAITSKPCLLLLGEPGIGKTDAMEEQCRQAQADLPPREELIAIDCRIQRDLSDLFDDPKFNGWIEGQHRLHLFIDSLDEHPVDDAASRIIGKLKRGPIEQLCLRIACRTAEVPPILEPELHKLWGSDASGNSRLAVYELAPLRKKDVELAARSIGINASDFTSAIAQRDAAALAIKPVTLNFLLRTACGKDTLPKTRWEVYEIGCRILCEERSKSRRTNKQIGHLNWSRRMAIASRIAAACVLGNRSMIYHDMDPGDLPEGTLLSDVLGGEIERAGQDTFEVDAESVGETLTMTGLFTERGQSRLLGWAHQTYAEFLTARFLRERGLRLEDLSDVLYPSGDRVQIVPALREIAAWMASMDVDMFRKLMQDDPRTLLQSDVAMVDDLAREKLVGALLERFANRELTSHDVGGERVYRKLRHPRLKEQLETWIRCKDNHLIVRHAAIDIAVACSVQELQEALVDLALDDTDSYAIRVWAAYAIANVADAHSLQRLLPLAHGQAGEDPDDDLKGCALSALWPKYISANELFQCLKSPRKSNYSGSYCSFIVNKVVQHLSEADLHIALVWAAAQPAFESISPFAELIDRLILRAWECMDDPGVVKALVHLANVRGRRHEELVSDWRADPSKHMATEERRRKKFVAAFLELTEPLNDEYWFLESQGLLLPDDIAWMVEQLDVCTNSALRKRWADMIAAGLRHRGFFFESVNAVVEAKVRHRELQEALHWLEPIQLDSPQAEEARQSWATCVEVESECARRRQRQHGQVQGPLLVELVPRCLDRFEQGDVDAFAQLQLEMSRHPTANNYLYDAYQPDLTKLLGWRSADENTRHRILSSAKKYLIDRSRWPRLRLSQNTIGSRSYTGFRGLLLLLTFEREFVESLPTAFWKAWAHVVVGCCGVAHGDATREKQRQLVALSYRHAQEETLWALGAYIEQENQRDYRSNVVYDFAHCWDQRLGWMLLLKLQDPSLTPSFFGSLLDELIKYRVAGARDYAVSLLSAPLPKRKSARARVQASAQALFAHADDAGWPVLQQVFQADPPFGYKVVLGTGARISRRLEPRWQGLSETQLADLFLWLEEQFPHEEDHNRLVGRMVTPLKYAIDLRDALLANLAQRGTRASLEEIRRIERVHAGKDWISFIRIKAQERTLAAARTLLSPSEVFALKPRTATRPGNNEPRTMNEIINRRLVERRDVLLMTATEVETKAVLDAAATATGREFGRLHGARTYHDLGEVSGARVLLVSTAQPGSDTPGGSLPTALKAIGDVAPNFIIMVGIAFGVDPAEQPIGRVLVSRQLQNYGPMRVGTDKNSGAQTVIARGDKVSSSPLLLDRFGSAKLSWKGGGAEGCESCLLLSGPSLVDNVDYRDSIVKLFPEAKGGEMEGAGLYGAAIEENVPWIVVKAICDYADGNKRDDKEERQALAAGRSASFVLFALGLGGFGPRSR